jgi:integrase
MHIDLLAQILAVAVDHGRIPSNPAVGKRRRLKLSKPRPVHLDSAEEIAVLLEAAGELDRGESVIEVRGRRGRTWTQRLPLQTTGRRAAIATLLLGGGRASATGAMLWRDVDLAKGRFEVGRDKTDAGMREVDMLTLLQEILTEHKAPSARTGPDDPVFVTSTGKPRSRHNIRQDVVDAVVAHANRLVEERGLQPLPVGITPHKLRQTFASILVAIGKDPTYVMQQLGHTDPAFTLRVYAHTMRRSEDERERLGASSKATIGHTLGTKRPNRRPQPSSGTPTETQKPPSQRGFLGIGAPGFEPGTSPTRTVRATRLRHAPKMFPSIPQARPA